MGFRRELLDRLVLAGLATVVSEAVQAGARRSKVERYQIAGLFPQVKRRRHMVLKLHALRRIAANRIDVASRLRSEPRPPVGCSPRVRPLLPRPPPEVAFLCSVASSVLQPHPDFSSAYILGVRLLPSRVGPDKFRARVRPPMREVLPMQATTPWEMLPSRQRTRSAPRN